MNALIRDSIARTDFDGVNNQTLDDFARMYGFNAAAGRFRGLVQDIHDTAETRRMSLSALFTGTMRADTLAALQVEYDASIAAARKTLLDIMFGETE